MRFLSDDQGSGRAEHGGTRISRKWLCGVGEKDFGLPVNTNSGASAPGINGDEMGVESPSGDGARVAMTHFFRTSTAGGRRRTCKQPLAGAQFRCAQAVIEVCVIAQAGNPVPPQRRRVATFTQDLIRLRIWQVSLRVTEGAMESTGTPANAPKAESIANTSSKYSKFSKGRTPSEISGGRTGKIPVSFSGRVYAVMEDRSIP
jgi:hypothetical protein